MNIKVVPKTKAQLSAQADPVSAGQPECIPYMLYDTQIFTSASTQSLTFFQTVQGNKSLSNMEGPGQLPDPQFFEVVRVMLDIELPPSVSSAAGVNDGAILSTYNILFGDATTTGAEQGVWTFSMSNKRYGPLPLSALHATGGPTGYGWGTVTTGANYANNGIMDGGFPVDKAWTIPPKIQFDITFTWGGTIVIAPTVIALRCAMAGVLHRRVL